MGRKGAKKGGGGMKGFLKQTRTAQNAATDDSASIPGSDGEEQEVAAGQKTVPVEPSHEQPTLDGETKAQLRERHKKELNAAKKEAAKLGKKKKQEATALVENVKARHEEELQLLKERLKDEEHSDDEVPDPVEIQEDAVKGAASTDKKSKSQKRREKEVQRMEERDARIREDIERLGVTERETEEASLQEKLNEIGCEIHEIRPDGHCLYRAIEDQLTQLSDFSQKLSHEELRKLAAEELRSRKDHYLPFYVAEEETEGMSFLEHCDRVEGTAEWGGELEIQALSQKLQRRIVIHSVELGEKTVGEQFEDVPLRLCFMQHAFHLGAHYNSVRLIH